MQAFPCEADRVEERSQGRCRRPLSVSDTASNNQKPILLWEALLTAPAVLLFGLLVIQRGFVYSRAGSGIENDNVWPLLVWALLATAALLASKPWLVSSRYGSQVRMLGAVFAVWSLMFLTVILLPWGRYRIVRAEALHGSVGISQFTHLQGWGLCRDVTDDRLGPYILTDVPLMERIVTGFGNDLLKEPTAARLLYGALEKHGVSFQELWSQEETRALFLACLVSEANPQYWFGLEWARELAQGPNHGRALSTEQAQQVLNWYLERLPTLDTLHLERLVFVACGSPELMTAVQRDELFLNWAGHFKKMESLAVQGLVARDQVREFLGVPRKLRVKLKVEGLNPLYSEDKIRPFAVPEMVLGLIRSCGMQTELVTDGPVDLSVSIKVTSVALYDYSQPVYSMETYYETRRRRTGKYSFSNYKVAQQRSVQTGSETRTHFAPVLHVSLDTGDRHLDLPESLLYWRDITYDKDKKRYVDVEGESSFGRMWPFGLDQRLFDFAFLKPHD